MVRLNCTSPVATPRSCQVTDDCTTTMMAVLRNPRPKPITTDASMVYGNQAIRPVCVSSALPISTQPLPARIGDRKVARTIQRPPTTAADVRPIDMVATAPPAATALPPWYPWTMGGT